MRYWDQKDHPITRFYNYLVSKGAWSETQEKEWKNESKKKVTTGFRHQILFILQTKTNQMRHPGGSHTLLLNNLRNVQYNAMSSKKFSVNFMNH